MTKLFIHNTLSRQKEEFTALDPAHVRMYVCGPTVYDFAHLGNARPVVVFDTLYRLLKRHFPHVTYARNITDVDDKIMAKAVETGESIDAITTRTTQAFHDDMMALNSVPPDIEPRCTQHIGLMVAMTQILIDKGHAYVAEGHVLFNVPSMANYGELSRRSRDELIAGARVDVAPYKKDAADFVLWKPSTADQVGWDSPWGRGRPGWHIECSAMAKEHLGITFDIHGGGLDLIFPHHENEIAQSRCAHDGKPLARYWMHNGFLTVDNEKMAKSLGNFFTVRQLLARAPGEALRIALLTSHYRQPLDFSQDALTSAKAKLDRWYGALRTAETVQTAASGVPETVENALLDDLNTPQAIAIIDELINDLNRATATKDRAHLKALVLGGSQALGLLQQNVHAWFKWQPADCSGPSDMDVDQQIRARHAARQAKNFTEADSIRDKLAAQGVILEDRAADTIWRRG
jgi:cysteinyl-tRNA synthetase